MRVLLKAIVTTLHGSNANQLFNSFENFTKLGDDSIQNFHLGRYILRYTIGNLVLRRRASRAVKHDFRKYIQRYTSPNENFEYSYPHSNALLQFRLKLERCKPYKAARHPTVCYVINDVKLFPTVLSPLLFIIVLEALSFEFSACLP